MLLRIIKQRNRKTSAEKPQELLIVPTDGSGQLHGPATMPPGIVPRRPFDRRLGEWQSSLDALCSYRESNPDCPLVLP